MKTMLSLNPPLPPLLLNPPLPPLLPLKASYNAWRTLSRQQDLIHRLLSLHQYLDLNNANCLNTPFSLPQSEEYFTASGSQKPDYTPLDNWELQKIKAKHLFLNSKKHLQTNRKRSSSSSSAVILEKLSSPISSRTRRSSESKMGYLKICEAGDYSLLDKDRYDISFQEINSPPTENLVNFSLPSNINNLNRILRYRDSNIPTKLVLHGLSARVCIIPKSHCARLGWAHAAEVAMKNNTMLTIDPELTSVSLIKVWVSEDTSCTLLMNPSDNDLQSEASQEAPAEPEASQPASLETAEETDNPEVTTEAMPKPALEPSLPAEAIKPTSADLAVSRPASPETDEEIQGETLEPKEPTEDTNEATPKSNTTMKPRTSSLEQDPNRVASEKDQIELVDKLFDESVAAHQTQPHLLSQAALAEMVLSASETNLKKCVKAESLGTFKKGDKSSMKKALIKNTKDKYPTNRTLEALINSLKKGGLETHLNSLGFHPRGMNVDNMKNKLYSLLTETVEKKESPPDRRESSPPSAVTREVNRAKEEASPSSATKEEEIPVNNMDKQQPAASHTMNPKDKPKGQTPPMSSSYCQTDVATNDLPVSRKFIQRAICKVDITTINFELANQGIECDGNAEVRRKALSDRLLPDQITDDQLPVRHTPPMFNKNQLQVVEASLLQLNDELSHQRRCFDLFLKENKGHSTKPTKGEDRISNQLNALQDSISKLQDDYEGQLPTNNGTTEGSNLNQTPYAPLQEELTKQNQKLDLISEALQASRSKPLNHGPETNNEISQMIGQLTELKDLSRAPPRTSVPRAAANPTQGHVRTNHQDQRQPEWPRIVTPAPRETNQRQNRTPQEPRSQPQRTNDRPRATGQSTNRQSASERPNRGLVPTRCLLIHDTFHTAFDEKIFNKRFQVNRCQPNSLKNLEQRPNAIKEHLLKHKPECTVINLGFHDLTKGQDPNVFITNMDKLIREILATSKTNICVNSVPKTRNRNTLNKTIDEANHELYDLITSIRSESQEYRGRLFSLSNSTLHRDNFYLEDGINYNPDGVRKLMLRLKDGFEKALRGGLSTDQSQSPKQPGATNTHTEQYSYE